MSNEKGVPEFLSADSIASSDNTLAKFRSITIQQESHESHTIKNIDFGKGVESPTVESSLFTKTRTTIFEGLNKNANLTCPERPYTLMRTHFELDPSKMGVSKDGKSKFEKIVETMNICLNDFSEYDFTFFPPGDCMVPFINFTAVSTRKLNLFCSYFVCLLLVERKVPAGFQSLRDPRAHLHSVPFHSLRH